MDYSGEPITPGEAQALRSRIKRLNLLSFGAAIPGFVLQFAGGAASGAKPGAGISPLAGVGGILVIIGLCIYARMKGRSWAWGFLGIFSIIGLFILYFLGSNCQHCGQKESYRTKTCGRCGAPVAA